jgi:hypothetical protein
MAKMDERGWWMVDSTCSHCNSGGTNRARCPGHESLPQLEQLALLTFRQHTVRPPFASRHKACMEEQTRRSVRHMRSFNWLPTVAFECTVSAAGSSQPHLHHVLRLESIQTCTMQHT